MAGAFKRELRSALFETGLLAAGAIIGGAVAFWLFGPDWLSNGIGAVVGAVIAYQAGRYAAGTTGT